MCCCERSVHTDARQNPFCLVEILDTLVAAINFANCLVSLERFEDAKSLMRKAMPVVRRVHEYTLMYRMRYISETQVQL